jgi:hypothetical protein
MHVDANHSCMFDIMGTDPNRPACWRREDLSRVGNNKCVEFCATESHKPWISLLHQQTEWYDVWHNYGCRFQEFIDMQLQQCFVKRRIESIQVDLDQRLANITFYNETATTTSADSDDDDSSRSSLNMT